MVSPLCIIFLQLPIKSSTIPARLNAPDDEHAVISANQQTPVHAKETTVYIDKIITIREVTSFNDAIVDGNNQVAIFEPTADIYSIYVYVT